MLDNLSNSVSEGVYYICLNKDCDIVYYNAEEEIIFRKNDTKIPIGFKKDANPKYICYCNRVTEEQIIKAVINDRARNIKDIIRITGAMKKCECETNNPLGKCCASLINEVINKAIQIEKIQQNNI